MTEIELVLAVLVLVATQVGVAVWLRSAWRADGRGGTGMHDSGGGSGRSYQAVASEIAKRQVAVLVEMAEGLQEYERACLAHSRRLCELMIGEWRRADLPGAPDVLPNDLDGAMRALARLGRQPLDEGAQSRIRKDLEPNTTVLIAYAEQTTSRLEENRFWLGTMLEKELRGYVTGMATTFSEMQPSPSSLRESMERYQAVLHSHPDASRAIERLSAGSFASNGNGGGH